MAIKREELLREPVSDYTLEDLEALGGACRRLMEIFEASGGFSARHVARAYRILREMLLDPDVTIFMGFTANLVSTGLRGLIASAVSRGLVDVIITTGGTVDHDIARAMGGQYFKGEFEADDVLLSELEIHRLGNVFVPLESYGPIIESKTHEVLTELAAVKERWTPSELLREVGLRLNDERSILFQAAKSGVPVFSPGLLDSAFGTAIYTFNDAARLKGGKKILVDFVGDMARLAEIVYSSKKLGAVIMGGGISKHHIIWWSQFRGGLDYAVYITTAVEWDGSLSGARTREAISWGKIKPRAKHVTVPGDATVIAPILFSALSDIRRERGERVD